MFLVGYLLVKKIVYPLNHFDIVKKEAANLVNYAEKATEVAEETTTEETTEE